MTDLNDLIPADSGVLILFAHSVNDAGQIIGDAVLTLNFKTVGVVLTPIGQPLGDLDLDCTVGIDDFLTLLALWGPCAQPCPPNCVGDLDDDCSVGITDFLMLLANWTA